MSYVIPNHCTICDDTLLGPPPPNALVVAETTVHNKVQAYHKSCIERLARIAQSLDMHGPFYGAAGNAASGSASVHSTGAMHGASRPQLQYNKDADSDDDTHDVRDAAAPQTPKSMGYVSEFDDRRDEIISELRMKLIALEKTIADGPAYVAQAVRKALTEAMIEYRSGRHVFDEGKGEWVTRT